MAELQRKISEQANGPLMLATENFKTADTYEAYGTRNVVITPLLEEVNLVAWISCKREHLASKA